MSYRTVEVELENGRVRPRAEEPLPAKARALLTILDTDAEAKTALGEAGLRRFLSRPALKLTEEQFRESMEADMWEQ
jgi:hypothetical protein